MAGLVYCRTINGRRDCKAIPVYLGPQWPPPSLEVPGWIVGPRPDPWALDQRLTPESARDLSVLATMDVLAAALSPAVEASLRAEIRRVVTAVPRPADTDIHF